MVLLMKSAHLVLEELKSNSGTLNKIKILNEASSNQGLKKLLIMTHDPEYVYGIKKLPDFSKIDFIKDDVYELNEALDEIHMVLVENKIRGHAARDFILKLMQHVTPEYRYILAGVIQRDLKIDMGTRVINKAIPGLLMDKHYMGAISYNEKKAEQLTSKPFFSQEKMDGMYANFQLDEATFISRNIKPVLLNIPELDKKLIDIKSTFKKLLGTESIILNGELLIRGLDRYTSNGLLMSISKIEAKVAGGQNRTDLKEFKKIELEFGNYDKIINDIYIVVWDLIPTKNFKEGFWDKPYEDRFDILGKAISKSKSDFVHLVPTKTLNTLAAAQKHFKKVRAAGGEGTIIKTLDGPWKTGKPIWQIKLKHELEVELEICGFRRGDPGTKYEDTLGAYIVKTRDGLIQTKSPGLNEDEREYGWTHQKERSGSIVSVKCNGISQDKEGNYSLLHPRFNGMRPDKDEADSLEEIIQAEAGIIKEKDLDG